MKLKEPKFLDSTKQKPQVNSVLLTSLVVVVFIKIFTESQQNPRATYLSLFHRHQGDISQTKVSEDQHGYCDKEFCWQLKDLQDGQHEQNHEGNETKNKNYNINRSLDTLRCRKYIE